MLLKKRSGKLCLDRRPISNGLLHFIQAHIMTVVGLRGSKIWFISEDEGKLSGMFGRIVENKPYQYISIEQLGEVIDGKEDSSGEEAQSWIGSHENYCFTEDNGVTTVDVEMIGDNISPEIAKMFEGMWPPALQKLKEICERQG